MLVLTRRPGEIIVIEAPDGKVIYISVEMSDRRNIKVGVEAPKEFQVWREEIWEARKSRKE